MNEYFEKLHRTAVEMAVLNVLYESPLSIDRIIKRINNNTDETFAVTRGDVHCVLSDWVDNGIARERPVEKQGNPLTYFALTDVGEDYFLRVSCAYRNYQHGVASIIRATWPDPSRKSRGKTGNIVSLG